MKSQSHPLRLWRQRAVLLGLLLTTASCSLIPQSEETQRKKLAEEFPEYSVVVQRYPQGSITSVADADQALKEVRGQRAAMQAQFEQKESACYNKFFVNACLAEVQEQRRDAMAELKSIEVESSAFKRRARVAERNRELGINQGNGKKQ